MSNSIMRTALRKAFSLGQTYWQQADSEYTSQHRKADETQAKFQALVEETLLNGIPETIAARDVLAERARQVSEEGWSTEHDDVHEGGELADAAAALTLEAGGYPVAAMQHWPWFNGIKPATPRRNLVKAAALLLAEIERLDRAAGTSVVTASVPCAGHAYPLHGEPGALEQGDA